MNFKVITESFNQEPQKLYLNYQSDHENLLESLAEAIDDKNAHRSQEIEKKNVNILCI